MVTMRSCVAATISDCWDTLIVAPERSLISLITQPALPMMMAAAMLGTSSLSTRSLSDGRGSSPWRDSASCWLTICWARRSP